LPLISLLKTSSQQPSQLPLLQWLTKRRHPLLSTASLASLKLYSEKKSGPTDAISLTNEKQTKKSLLPLRNHHSLNLYDHVYQITLVTQTHLSLLIDRSYHIRQFAKLAELLNLAQIKGFLLKLI